MDHNPKMNDRKRDEILDYTIQSEEAKKQLGALVEDRLSKLSATDPTSDMEELLARRALEREQERENYYLTRGERKRSIQKRKERDELAAKLERARQAEKEKKKAEKQRAKEARKAEKLELARSRKARDKATQERIKAEEQAEANWDAILKEVRGGDPSKDEAAASAMADEEPSRMAPEFDNLQTAAAKAEPAAAPTAPQGAAAPTAPTPAAAPTAPQGAAAPTAPTPAAAPTAPQGAAAPTAPTPAAAPTAPQGAAAPTAPAPTAAPASPEAPKKPKFIEIELPSKTAATADVKQQADAAVTDKLKDVLKEMDSFVTDEAMLRRDTIVPPGSPAPAKDDEDKDQLTLFAKQAALAAEAAEKSLRKEGFFRRAIRYIKTMRKQRRKMEGNAYYTKEKRRTAYRDIFRDCCSPISDAWEDFLDTTWNFLCTVARDSWSILLYVADFGIKTGYYLWSFVLYIWDLIWDFRYWVEANKTKFFRGFSIVVVVSAIVAVFMSSITAYEYVYYGKVLGVTRSKDNVYRTIEVLGDKLSEASGTNVSLDVERDIEFKKVMGFSLDIDTEDDILNTLTYMKELQVRAYAICINDKPAVVLENEGIATSILKEIQNAYAGERAGVEYTSIEFEELVTVQEVGVQLGDIWNAADAKRYLMTGNQQAVTHVVASGETFSEIAKAYGLSTQALAASNPDANPNRIFAGQELNMTAAVPLITMNSTEVATYNENIAYGTKYIDNASIYQGETEVKSKGVYGQQKVVAEISRTNGIETSRTIVSSEKLSDPVDEVLYRGTKPIPPKQGTGTFAYPIRTYTISSRFGMRWGRMHSGVDFAAATGTKIYASDGGVVTYSGWKNSYGYIVIISHGSLYETYYAHCSKLLVQAGDKVYQGQNIALVGSTGNSTGPHLHFEIRYNDTPQNPLNIL